MNHPITMPQDELAAFCRRNHIRKLALFGSVLRDDFWDDSDVDVLVEFEPGHISDLIRFAEMQDDLSAIMGYPVDLNTAGFVSRRFRQKVLNTAQVVYEREG